MRFVGLAVVGLLLSSGAAMAATGTSTTVPSTAPPGTNSTLPLSGGKPTVPMGSASAATTGPTTGAGFTTEADAAKACGASNVVWANTSTRVFHAKGDRYFGNTKHGTYMCMSTAERDGFHHAGARKAQIPKQQ